MSRRYFDDRGNRLFEVGDRVTRDGSDVHVIEAVWGKLGEGPETIDVLCVEAPSLTWIEVGERDQGALAWDYRFVDLDVEALAPPPEPLPPEWQAKFDAAKSVAEVLHLGGQYMKAQSRMAMVPWLNRLFAEHVEAAHRAGEIPEVDYQSLRADPRIDWKWMDHP